GCLSRVGERVGGWLGEGALQRFDRGLAGDLSRLVTADAVGDREEPLVGEVAVLVVVADEAGVGRAAGAQLSHFDCPVTSSAPAPSFPLADGHPCGWARPSPPSCG